MNPHDVLKSQLSSVLGPFCKEDTEDVVGVVLRTLEQQRIISYGKFGDIKLLSSAGRVLVAVLENPEMTQRALSTYLGMHEPQVHKALKNLEKAGLLVTTNLGRKKTFTFSGIEALRHPDISRFFDVIISLVKENIGNKKR